METKLETKLNKPISKDLYKGSNFFDKHGNCLKHRKPNHRYCLILYLNAVLGTLGFIIQKADQVAEELGKANLKLESFEKAQNVPPEDPEEVVPVSGAQ